MNSGKGKDKGKSKGKGKDKDNAQPKSKGKGKPKGGVDQRQATDAGQPTNGLTPEKKAELLSKQPTRGMSADGSDPNAKLCYYF